MLIENPDAFKAWLTSVLEPLCDADPEALAKYVYALVRKDKSVEALHEGMVQQLDVFLQKETKPFVELLFKTLEKQEYLTPAPTIPNANPPNPNIPAPVTPTRVPESTEIPIVKEHKPVIPVSSLPDLSVESLNGNSSTAIAPSTKPKEVVKEPAATGESKHKDAGRPGRIRHRSTSRNRSRSRSWERPRRSRSRDRSRERDQRRDRSRPWRNKSPPRRYERRRSPRSNSPVVQRLRSPRHNYRGRYRNRSPPRSPSRSRSRSPDKHSDKDKIKYMKEPLSGAGTPTQDSNHGDTDMRLTSTTQSIQSVVTSDISGALGTTGGNSSSSTNNSTTFHPKRRCRDFDEKGYCMRGDMCPYDHGVDPVVLEDTALGNVLTFGPNGQPPIDAAPQGGGMLPPNMVRPNPGHVMHMPHHRPMHPAMTVEYNPSAPSMWNPRSGNGAFRGGLRPGMFHGPPPGMIPGGPPNMNLPPGAHNHVQRELISVPVMDSNIHKQPHPQMVSDGIYPRTSDFMPLQDFGGKKKSGFDFNRLGPRIKNNPVNCSLELKKVPRGLNNITHLNNHFSKFGKIVNIQVNYEGDQEAALITFSSHAEANAAYKSTEAVLNNRFIKVFWHSNGDGKQENTPPVQRSVKDRLGNSSTPPQIAPPNTNKVLNVVQPKATNNLTTNNNEDDKTAIANNNNSVIAAPHPVQKSNVYIPAKQQSADSRAQANAAIKKGQEILAQKEELKKKQEEKRKEAVKLTQELYKRKQDLLDKQLKQQNVLIEKLEKVKGDRDQREQIKEAITTLQQSIEDIRKSLMEAVKNRASSQILAAKVVQNRKSKDEAQKELLDAELDLITKQQEGADTSDLQKKVFELKRHAQQLGCLPVIPRRGTTMPVRIQRGFKFIRGGLKSARNHHPSSFANASVDHRPTKLLVSGYEFDEKTDVLAHFAQYGEISDYVSDDSTPSVVLNFKTRKEAEVAILKGKHFQDRTLSVTWCTNVQLSNQLSQRRDSRSMMLSESDDDHLLDSIPEDELNIEGVDLSEEALLQDDEEEEEENEEDRSWRR